MLRTSMSKKTSDTAKGGVGSFVHIFTSIFFLKFSQNFIKSFQILKQEPLSVVHRSFLLVGWAGMTRLRYCVKSKKNNLVPSEHLESFWDALELGSRTFLCLIVECFIVEVLLIRKEKSQNKVFKIMYSLRAVRDNLH